MVHDRLKANAVPIQLTIGKEDTFKGIIDLVEMDADIYYDQLGKDMRVEPIPEDMVDIANEYREKLLDAVSMFDDEIMELYLEGKEIPTSKIRTAIRKATCAVEMVPVTCGSSYRNKGVQKLLDAIVDYMPAPTDVPAIKGGPSQLLPRVLRYTDHGLLRPQCHQGQARAYGPHPADARQSPRGHRVRLLRRHRRRGGSEEHHHRRHAVR